MFILIFKTSGLVTWQVSTRNLFRMVRSRKRNEIIHRTLNNLLIFIDLKLWKCRFLQQFQRLTDFKTKILEFYRLYILKKIPKNAVFVFRSYFEIFSTEKSSFWTSNMNHIIWAIKYQSDHFRDFWSFSWRKSPIFIKKSPYLELSRPDSGFFDQFKIF